MRTGSLWAEALRSAWATKVSTLLVLLVTASMCFAAIATAGRGAANQAEIQAQLAASGSRQLRVIDTQRVGVLTDSALAVVAGIDRGSRAVSPTVPGGAWVAPHPAAPGEVDATVLISHSAEGTLRSRRSRRWRSQTSANAANRSNAGRSGGRG